MAVALTGLPPVSAPLPWQADSWQQLTAALEAGRLPHALLLAGPEGTGKARLALALARLLLCHQPSAGHNCGSCPACEYSSQGSHGDFRWLQPQDKSRVIKIDQVRELVAFGGRTAGFGRRKVLVLAPADAMTISAANALLKSLEEPAPDTHFILVCRRLHGVPATVRSRCRILKLPLPPAEPSLAWLDQLTGERATSERLLSLAEGRPLVAERLYTESSAESLESVHRAVTALLEGRAALGDTVAALGELSAEALLALCIGYCERQLRELDAVQLTQRGPGLFDLLDALRARQAAVRAGANPNRQLLAESSLLQLQGELGPPGSGATMKAAFQG